MEVVGPCPTLSRKLMGAKSKNTSRNVCFFNKGIHPKTSRSLPGCVATNLQLVHDFASHPLTIFTVA